MKAESVVSSTLFLMMTLVQNDFGTRTKEEEEEEGPVEHKRRG